MHNSKLIYFFKLLQPAEVKRLYTFLKSPFYNTNSNVIQLYRLLRSFYPNFDSRQLTKERVFCKIFPHQDYENQKLLNLMYEYTSLLKKFLQVLQSETDEQLSERLLLQAMAKRSLNSDAFARQVRNVEKRLLQHPYRDAEFFHHQFCLKHAYTNHPQTDKYKLPKDHYEAYMQQLDQWYILQKLSLSYELRAREQIFAEKYQIWLLPEIQKTLDQKAIQNTSTGAYLDMLKLLEDGDEQTYFRLKNTLQQGSQQLKPESQRKILSSLINYAKGRENAFFRQDSFQLCQYGLELQLLIQGRTMSDLLYIEIVNIAIRNKEMEWSKSFISNYEPYLVEQQRKNAKSLALTFWLFADGKLSEAMDQLQQISFSNTYYQIQARMLLIVIYYEFAKEDQNYRSLVLSRCLAFARFLRRNQRISEDQKQSALRFIRRMRKLEQLYLPFSEEISKKALFQYQCTRTHLADKLR